MRCGRAACRRPAAGDRGASRHGGDPGMFEDLSVRVKLEEEAAARIRKEGDELLQKDAKVSQGAIEVLAELEMEQDLRRMAEDRSTTLQ